MVEQERWSRFLAVALGEHRLLPWIPEADLHSAPNPVRGDPRLITDGGGMASLPEVDNGWVRDDLVAVLESYFRLQWGTSHLSDRTTATLT